MIDASRVSSRNACLVGVQVDDAVAVHGDEVDGPAGAVQGTGRLHDGRVLDRADDEVARLVAGEAAEQGEVVGLGAAGGEHDLLLAGAEHGGHLGARRFDGRARLPPQPVKLGRVAVVLARSTAASPRAPAGRPASWPRGRSRPLFMVTLPPLSDPRG